jgi:hypothetical protein
MLMDKNAEFCDATALNTGGADTYNLGDVYDIGENKDLGVEDPAWVVIQIQTAATSGGSATAQFQLVSDSSTAPSTDGTQTIHFITKPFPVADLVAGYQIRIPIPMEKPDYERYIGVQQVTAVAAFTAGAIDAFITRNPSNWKAYPGPAN